MLIDANNPIIFADVPDSDVIKAEKNGKIVYYMVSTTMHLSPGVPVMRSYDLVHWEMVSYVYDQLEENDACALKNGKNDYSCGSWASSIRYDEINKRFFVAFTCQSTEKTYIFSTECIEEGKWHRSEIDYVKCYDNSLFFEGDKRYILYMRPGTMNVLSDSGEAGKVHYGSCCIREMLVNTTTWDVTLLEEHQLIPVTNYENPPEGLWGEGFHAYKFGEYYYIFMIQCQNLQRQEILWRSKTLLSNDWEKRKVFTGDLVTKEGRPYLPFTGIAQGGVIENEYGDWYAMLFQDYGSVGRIPVLIPMYWDEDAWPVIGNAGKSADVEVSVRASACNAECVVADDEFDGKEPRFVFSDKFCGHEDGMTVNQITAGLTCAELEELAEKELLQEAVEKNEYGYNGSALKLVWQWTHNPNNNLWSLTEREGWLRLKGGITADSIINCRNVLTQRTFGKTSSAVTCLDYSNLKEQDIAGLSAFQNQYGFVGVTRHGEDFYVLMHRAMQKDDTQGCVIEKKRLPGNSNCVYLRVDCDFTELKDEAYFYYSLDGIQWIRIGDTLHMKYDWPHFVGYRFALFLLPVKEVGGCADFDYFHVSSEILER